MSKILKSLYMFNEETYDGMLVYFKDFVDLLKTHHEADDKLKEIRSANIKRELRGQILKLEHGTAIPFLSILKYVFKHTDNLKLCSNLAKDIELSILKSKNVKCTRHLYDLYKTISTSTFIGAFLDIYTKEPNFKILETSINTLYEDYKVYFSEESWNRICLFENHFSKSCDVSEVFEESIQQRWKAFEHLTNVNNITKRLTTVANKLIKSRNKRYEAHNQDTSVEISGFQRHRPAIIESEIFRIINSFYPGYINLVACVDVCGQSRQHYNTVDIYIQATSENQQSLTDICTYIADYLRRSHFLNCNIVNVFKPGTLDKYRRKDNTTARFSCRDDILLGKLEDAIIISCTMSTQAFDTQASDENCKVCFDEHLPEPLSALDFSITKEWCLDVPLDVQLLFESFINRETFGKAVDKSSFLKKKLERFYSSYDVLLNTLNKNFTGVLQQANTDELVMNYQSVNTVFSVTASTGTTSSLSSAEKRLKDRNVDDLCYFNTYLKKYPLAYETDAGFVEKCVSLRDCHLIIMLDNLVRLKYHSDPNPGESRSGQICTLPITIQGVPKDWKGTEYWHDSSICDGENICKCKRKIKLGKTDVRKSLIQLSEDERDTWGFPKMLTDINSGELATYLPEGLIKCNKEKSSTRTTIQITDLSEDSAVPIDLSETDMKSSDEERLNQRKPRDLWYNKKAENLQTDDESSQDDEDDIYLDSSYSVCSESDEVCSDDNELLEFGYESDERHDNTVAWEKEGQFEGGGRDKEHLSIIPDSLQEEGKAAGDYDEEENADSEEENLYNLLLHAEETMDTSMIDEDIDLILDELDTSYHCWKSLWKVCI